MDVVKEFVADIEMAYSTEQNRLELIDEWPDLLVTYAKAKVVLLADKKKRGKRGR